MGTVDLNDSLNDSLFYFFHSVKFFIQNTACLYRINRFKIIIFPLNIHHNGKCSLCMTSFFLGNLMRTCYCQIPSGPEADIVRHGPACTGHKISNALNAGKLHIISVFTFVLILRKFCRCTTCQETLDHKLKKTIFCR